MPPKALNSPSSENSDKIPGKPKLNQVKEASTKQRALYNPVKFLAEINQSSNLQTQTSTNQFTDFKHSNLQTKKNLTMKINQISLLLYIFTSPRHNHDFSVCYLTNCLHPAHLINALSSLSFSLYISIVSVYLTCIKMELVSSFYHQQKVNNNSHWSCLA